MTYANVTLDGKRQRQPDAGVAERIRQRTTDDVMIVLIDSWRPHVQRLVMRKTYRDDEREVHDVTER